MPTNSTDLQIAAALCEQVYRRDPNDQQIRDVEFAESNLGTVVLFNTEESRSALLVQGFRYEDGYFYNDDTGFVARLAQANGKLFVVYRGSAAIGRTDAPHTPSPPRLAKPGTASSCRSMVR